VTRPNLRPQAEVDLVERAHYYREEGGSDLGERFFDGLVSAASRISRAAGSTSPAAIALTSSACSLMLRTSPPSSLIWSCEYLLAGRLRVGQCWSR
jgi:hypothetical protein